MYVSLLIYVCTLFIIDRKFSERDILVKDSITDGMGRASNRLTVSCTVWTEAEKCSRFRLFLRLIISETALVKKASPHYP